VTPLSSPSRPSSLLRLFLTLSLPLPLSSSDLRLRVEPAPRGLLDGRLRGGRLELERAWGQYCRPLPQPNAQPGPASTRRSLGRRWGAARHLPSGRTRQSGTSLLSLQTHTRIPYQHEPPSHSLSLFSLPSPRPYLTPRREQVVEGPMRSALSTLKVRHNASFGSFPSGPLRKAVEHILKHV